MFLEVELSIYLNRRVFKMIPHIPLKPRSQVFSWSLDYCPCTFIDYFITTHVVGDIKCVIGHKLVNSHKMKIELLECLRWAYIFSLTSN